MATRAIHQNGRVRAGRAESAQEASCAPPKGWSPVPSTICLGLFVYIGISWPASTRGQPTSPLYFCEPITRASYFIVPSVQPLVPQGPLESLAEVY